MPYLDGHIVEDSVIDPAKHRYIGMFRRPYDCPNAYVACTCGAILQTMEITREHWQAGHWDQPQYETMQMEQER